MIMFRQLRWWWQNFILRQWRKYYTVGGHCGLCGKWLPDVVVDINWTWGLCPDESAGYQSLPTTTIKEGNA